MQASRQNLRVSDGAAGLAPPSSQAMKENQPAQMLQDKGEMTNLKLESQRHGDALARLVDRLVDGSLEQSHRDYLRSYAYRLLSSRIGASKTSGGDEFQLVERMKRQFISKGGEEVRKAQKFAELYRRLSQRRVISNRWGILYVLNELKNGSAQAVQQGKIVGTMQSSVGMFELISTSPPPLPELSSELEHSLRVIDAPSSQAPGWKSDTAKGKRGDRVDFEVSESVLVRDVIFAMQGIDGQYIKYDSALDGYAVTKGHGVPSATRDLIRRIAECGWLYRRINNSIMSWSSSKAVGLVCQGLAAGLQSELSEYYRLVAVLHAHIAGDIKGADQQVRKISELPSGQAMTLRRLLVWVQEPLARLRVMALLCDAALGSAQHGAVSEAASATSSVFTSTFVSPLTPSMLKGGQLATAICAHARHGDPAVQSLMQRILRPVCAPLLTHIRRWISDGEIEDPWGEFFIENDPSRADHHWEEKYKLRAEMLPSFVSKDLASKILLIGKSINFMRKCCRQGQYAGEVPSEVKGFGALEYGQWEELEEVVRTSAGVRNKALVSALFQRYHLHQHCLAIKRYLLFGQGDFVRHLFDLLANNILPGTKGPHHHNLTGIVETAIRSSSQSAEDADVRERVHVSTMEATSGDDLFSVFTLEYKVDMPCNAIISEKAMRKYKRIFNFLWGLKRVEQALTTSWRRCSDLAHIGTHCVTVRGMDRKGHRKCQDFALGVVYKSSNLKAQHEMMHFVSNLQYYMMFEVLECSWEAFSAEMQAAEDVDELISAHNRYVEKILELSLLTEESEEEKRQIDRVLKSILDYCLTQQRLAEFAETTLERHGALSLQSEERELERLWGVRPDDGSRPADAPPLVPPGELTGMIQLRAAEFREAFGRLREMLGSTKIADLRSLNFRLDFSEFYSNPVPGAS